MTKQILIVTRGFFPANSPRAFRATELAKEFSRQGHSVTVITPKDDDVHRLFERQHGIVIKDMGKPRWRAVVLRGGTLTFNLRRLVKRFLGLFFLYPDIELARLVRKSLRSERGYDIVLSIAVPYPIHWGVALVRSQKHPIGKVWIADCGDPFMGQENDTFTPPFYFKYVEKWFCRRVDLLTVPTEGAIGGYYSEFRDKIAVVPQGFRFEDVQTSTSRKNPKPIFAYAGLLIPGRRDPSELLEYLSSLTKEFEFHLYTQSRHLVNRFLEDSRIFVHDYIPRVDLLQRLSEMDFVVNFENVGEKQTPSKLIDYVIIDKPILGVKTGGLQKEVVNEFLEGNYSRRFIVRNPNQYRIENVVHKLLSLAEGVVKNGN